MEAQLEDIREGATLKFVKQLRDNINDCAKNIRSNDDTFKLSTIQSVTDKFIDLMSSYVDTVQGIESSQRAFITISAKVEDEESGQVEEYADLDAYTKLFEETVVRENENSSTNEIEAQVELEKIIRPYVDEDIQVEAPSLRVPKDPITKQDIKIAMMNTNCRHIYDKETIEEYFAQKEKSNKRVQCPQAGCANRNMRRDELVLDEETNKLIQSL